MNRTNTNEYIRRLNIGIALLRIEREESTSRHEVHYIDTLIEKTNEAIKRLIEHRNSLEK